MSSASVPRSVDPIQTDTVEFRYQTVRTSCWTFEAEKISVWLKNHLPVGDEDAVILNACAGETRLADDIAPSVIRNDMNPQRNAMLQADVCEIGEYLGENSVDVVIHDPPFSSDMSTGKYDTGEQTRFDEETMAQFRRVLKPGGKLIQFAYSPQLHTHFEMENVTLWNRVGRGFDYASTVQTYRPEVDGVPSVQASETVPFNPFMPAVTGDANFGGNCGGDVTMSITGKPNESTTTQLFDEIDRLKDGLTLIITDQQRDYRPLKDRNTAIVSLSEDVTADNHLSIYNLSERIPTGVLDTVVVDVDRKAFCWNTYYEKDKTWEETTERTGYATAVKREAAKLLGPDGQLMQVGQTATNAPNGSGFVRTHVALTASTDRIVSPFVTVDKRADPETVSEPVDNYETERLWPMARLANEQTPPSTFRYTTEKEGMYHHPAYAVDCPVCGSLPGNLCLTDSGEPVPYGHFHDKRAEQGKQAFYGEGLTLPLAEYIKGWIKSTDPGRPKTGGGRNDTPPAAQDDDTDTADNDDPVDSETPEDDTEEATEDSTETTGLTLSDFH